MEVKIWKPPIKDEDLIASLFVKVSKLEKEATQLNFDLADSKVQGVKQFMTTFNTEQILAMTQQRKIVLLYLIQQLQSYKFELGAISHLLHDIRLILDPDYKISFNV